MQNSICDIRSFQEMKMEISDLLSGIQIHDILISSCDIYKLWLFWYFCHLLCLFLGLFDFIVWALEKGRCKFIHMPNLLRIRGKHVKVTWYAPVSNHRHHIISHKEGILGHSLVEPLLSLEKRNSAVLFNAHLYHISIMMPCIRTMYQIQESFKAH